MSVWDELKNCPFCDGEPSLTTSIKGEFTFVKVVCKRCGATGPRYVSTEILASAKDVANDAICMLAAERWNRRAEE